MARTRREFLKTSTTIAAATLWLPRPAITQPALVGIRAGMPGPHTLAQHGVDAARSAGASYADVRLTLTNEQQFRGPLPSMESELFGAGVRVLVNGYWGFAGSAVWSVDEMARLARTAVAQAKANGQGSTRPVELGTVVPVVRGSWVMPVAVDPFDVPIGEKIDWMKDAVDSVQLRQNGIPSEQRMSFRRQRGIFASSEGSSWDQTTYLSGGAFIVAHRGQYSLGLGPAAVPADFLSPAGKGWEHFTESGLVEAIPQLIDDADQARRLTPVDVGVHDIVFSANAMASLLDATVGTATELDRAIGNEANAGGVSYLSAPLDMLGSYVVGSKLVTVTGDRSTPGGAATIRWDDEAVAPEPFTIVKEGVLTDFQTTREQADWLAPYYKKTGQPVRSHGCAASESALRITAQSAPNLRLVPGANGTRFEDLVAETKRGIAVFDMTVNMDHQQSDGLAAPRMRQIVNGKLGMTIAGAGLLIRSADIWKNVAAIGGTASERMFGLRRGKGEPAQRMTHSVRAVPAKVTQVKVVDLMRKA